MAILVESTAVLLGEELAVASKEEEMHVEVSVFTFPVWISVKRKLSADHSFFAQGNVERELWAKQVSFELSADEVVEISAGERLNASMPCPIAGCHAKFSGLADFEVHYSARHMATCSVCRRQYPTNRLMNLHVAENHDSFFKAKVARGYLMYECLIESCSGKFQSETGRHQHLVDFHKFPRSFQFSQKKHPSQKQRKKSQERRQSFAEHSSSYQAGSPGSMRKDVKQQARTAKQRKPRGQEGEKRSRGAGAVSQFESTDQSVNRGQEDEKMDNAAAQALTEHDVRIRHGSTETASSCSLPGSSSGAALQDRSNLFRSASGQDQEAMQAGSGSSLAMDVDLVTKGLSRLSTASRSSALVPPVISFGRRRCAPMAGGATVRGRGRGQGSSVSHSPRALFVPKDSIAAKDTDGRES